MSERAPSRYETRDVDPRLPLYTGISALSLLVVVLCIVWLISGGANGIPSLWAGGPFEQPLNSDGPALEDDPRGDLLTARQAAQHQLESYGWVDRDRDVVHIPIEHAIDLYVARNSGSGTPGMDGDGQ
jgi:hypothetical protein